MTSIFAFWTRQYWFSAICCSMALFIASKTKLVRAQLVNVMRPSPTIFAQFLKRLIRTLSSNMPNLLAIEASNWLPTINLWIIPSFIVQFTVWWFNCVWLYLNRLFFIFIHKFHSVLLPFEYFMASDQVRISIIIKSVDIHHFRNLIVKTELL